MRSIAVSLPPARRVLDLGCGTGWVIGEAAADGTPLRVGIDISFDCLKAAKSYPIAPVAADGLCLPFGNGTFDVVVSHVCLPYLNTDRALSEIYRVLQPGGSFLVTVHNFRYLRQRFWNSLKSTNWKDMLFCGYMAANGALNHLGLSQTQTWWRRTRFETVNTVRGIHRAACRRGFSLVSTEYDVNRIFFAVTARKPNPATGHVLPAPGWSVYCPLRHDVPSVMPQVPALPKVRTAAAGRAH